MIRMIDILDKKIVEYQINEKPIFLNHQFFISHDKTKP